MFCAQCYRIVLYLVGDNVDDSGVHGEGRSSVFIAVTVARFVFVKGVPRVHWCNLRPCRCGTIAARACWGPSQLSKCGVCRIFLYLRTTYYLALEKAREVIASAVSKARLPCASQGGVLTVCITWLRVSCQLLFFGVHLLRSMTRYLKMVVPT